MYIFEVYEKRKDDSCRFEIPVLDESLEMATDDEATMLEEVAIFIKCKVLECLLLHKQVPKTHNISISHEKKCPYMIAVQVELPNDCLFSLDETRRILGVTQPRVSGLIHDKRLVALKKGQRRLVTRESLEAYLQTPRKPGRPAKANAGQSDYAAASQIEM